jgi:MFS family permease
VTSAAHPGCDAAVAMGTTQVSDVKRPRLVLFTTILASSLAMIDGSVVNVGLPAIGHTLKADASDLQWVINAYLLPLSALLLLGGALGDRYGRRRLLVSGVTLFALASATCAFAPSIGWLLLGRGVQGIGAAILLPNSLAILGGAFSGEARGRAIGLWAAAGAMAAAIGPVLGGWLIDTIGWPSIFLLNLPLAVAAVVLAWMSVPVESSAERTPLDLAGAVLATASLSGLAWGLTLGSGPGGWTMAPVVAGLAGIMLMAVRLQNLHRPQPADFVAVRRPRRPAGASAFRIDYSGRL